MAGCGVGRWREQTRDLAKLKDSLASQLETLRREHDDLKEEHARIVRELGYVASPRGKGMGKGRADTRIRGGAGRGRLRVSGRCSAARRLAARACASLSRAPLAAGRP